MGCGWRGRQPKRHCPIRLILPWPSTLLLHLLILAFHTPLIPSFSINPYSHNVHTSGVLHDVGRALNMVMVILLPDVGTPKVRLLERVPRRDGIKVLPVSNGGRTVEAVRVPSSSSRGTHAPGPHIEGREVRP